MPQALRLVQGVTSFLYGKLAAILPDMNTEMLSVVISETPMVPFALAMGFVPVTSEPRLCVMFSYDTRRRIDVREKAITVAMKVTALIPVAGDNTSGNYEMARQVSADHVLTLLDDDTQMQLPTVNTGLLGQVTALEADCGDLVDIWPYKFEDNVTTARGWEVQYTATFAIRTR